MRAFADCANLKHVNIPKGLTTLGTEIFSNSGLETVVFEEGALSVGSAMFQDCTKPTSQLPSDITKTRCRFRLLSFMLFTMEQMIFLLFL